MEEGVAYSRKIIFEDSRSRFPTTDERALRKEHFNARILKDSGLKDYRSNTKTDVTFSEN